MCVCVCVSVRACVRACVCVRAVRASYLVSGAGLLRCRDHYWPFSRQNWESEMRRLQLQKEQSAQFVIVCTLTGLIKN